MRNTLIELIGKIAEENDLTFNKLFSLCIRGSGRKPYTEKEIDIIYKLINSSAFITPDVLEFYFGFSKYRLRSVLNRKQERRKKRKR